MIDSTSDATDPNDAGCGQQIEVRLGTDLNILGKPVSKNHWENYQTWRARGAVVSGEW